MEKRGNEWMDALNEQDIPATVVDWESIMATSDDDLDTDSENLDAERTLEDASPF